MASISQYQFTPKEAQQRFAPARLLSDLSIPHSLWGEDALGCNGSPLYGFSPSRDPLEILVKLDDLERAVHLILNSFQNFQLVPLNAHDLDRDLRTLKWMGGTILRSTDGTADSTNEVVILPDKVMNFDVTDPAATQSICKTSLDLHKDFINIRTPTFHAYLDALLPMTDKLAECQVPDDYRVKAIGNVVELVRRQAKCRVLIRHSFTQIPGELWSIAHGLQPSNIPLFEKFWLDEMLADNPCTS